MIRAAIRKRDLIEQSLRASPGGHTFEGLLQDVAKGESLVLEGERAVMVLEIVPVGPSLNGWIVGGDLREIFAMLPGAEALARAMGCKYASFGEGRPGWRRVLRPLGYQWTDNEFRKAL